jgi:hypothetical protein
MKRWLGGGVAVCGAVVLLTFGATGAQAHRRAAAEKAQIIGGASAASDTFGMMAFVYYDDGTDAFACSGTVLSSNVILTAGHCGEDTGTGVVYHPSGYQVVTGSVDWADSAVRQVSGVQQVIVNPGFDISSLQYDATLLVLNTPTTAPAVTLATNPVDVSTLNAGSPAMIAGWGATVPGGSVVEPLRYANTVIQSAGYCIGQATYFDENFDAATELCAQNYPYNDRGSCHGDSGGPLLATVGSQVVEIGITSWAAATCSTAHADFFTRADAIEPWAGAWIQAVKPAPTPPPTPAPVPAPAPAPAPSPRAPQPGTYNGMTSQRGPIQFHIVGSSVTAARFTFRLRCRRGTPSFTFRPLRGGAIWKLNQFSGFGFSRRFRDGGERYRLTGVFSSTGGATGTLSSRWSSRRYGSCSTGTLKWQATRAP